MKKLFSLFTFLLVHLASFAINFQGVISSDATWTLANSPYIITGPVQVESNATLTIEPGVEVVLIDTPFWVDGNIYAAGTPGKPIKFTYDKSMTSYPMIFKGIECRGYDDKHATFQYCNFSDFDLWGIMGGDHDMEYIVENCTFINCSHGISLYHGHVFVRNNTFLEGGYSMSLGGVEVEVTNNKIQGADGYGMRVIGAPNMQSLIIKDNSVTYSIEGIIIEGEAVHSVENNTMIGNGWGLRINATGTLAAPVKNNILSDNGTGIVMDESSTMQS